MSPVRPEEMCTTSPPAKSKAPIMSPMSEPSPPHTICASGAYTTTTHTATNAHTGAELHAPGHRTGNDGAGDHGKGHLEDDVDDGRVARCQLRVIGQRTLAGQHREGIGRALGLGHHVVHDAQAPDLVEAAKERQRPVAAVGERPCRTRPKPPRQCRARRTPSPWCSRRSCGGKTPIEEGESGRHRAAPAWRRRA